MQEPNQEVDISLEQLGQDIGFFPVPCPEPPF